MVCMRNTVFSLHSKVPLKPHVLHYQARLFSLIKKGKYWFRLKVIKSGQNQLCLDDAKLCIQKAVLAAWPCRCSELGLSKARFHGVREVKGTRNVHSPPPGANGKEIHCSTSLFLSLKSPLPSGKLDPISYFSLMPPLQSQPMSNLLYTLMSLTPTHVSYMEVSITHARQTSR